jgi:hypothetical protein
LTLLSHKQFLISTFSVHHLVQLLLHKVSHHCAWEEQNVRSLIAWPLASKISHGKSYSHDHACPRTLGIVVRAPLFDLQLHHGTIPCDGGLPGFSVCLGQSLRQSLTSKNLWGRSFRATGCNTACGLPRLCCSNKCMTNSSSDVEWGRGRQFDCNPHFCMWLAPAGRHMQRKRCGGYLAAARRLHACGD